VTEAEAAQVVATTPTKRDAEEQAKKFVSWLVALAVFSMGLAVFVYSLLDFHPMTLRSYEIRPVEACPAEPVAIEYSANMERPTLGFVRTGEGKGYEVSSQWYNLDTEQRIVLPTFTETFKGEYGELFVLSDTLRVAPNEPGRWRIEADITVHGFQVFRPVEQEMPTVYTEAVRVRAFDDPRCRVAYVVPE
jgi:hypothetical protein